MSDLCRMNMMMIICRAEDVHKFVGFGTFVQAESFGNTRNLIVTETLDLIRFAERGKPGDYVPFYGTDISGKDLYRFYADEHGFHQCECDRDEGLVLSLPDDGIPDIHDLGRVQQYLLGEKRIKELIGK